MRPIGDWSMSMTLSRNSRPVRWLCGAGLTRAPFSRRAIAWYIVSIISVDLPPPDTPVTATNSPSGTSTETFLRLLPVAPSRWSFLRLAAASAARAASGCPCAPREIRAGDRLSGCLHDVLGRALGDDVPAMDAGAGADVDHVVGGEDRVLVVLDDDHRVADVAQPLQRLEQPRIVALVQPDRGLVEHVEHAGQPRADLRRQPDALALAARQRARVARQRQVVEPDVVEEAEPLADLLEDALADLVLRRRQLRRQLLEPLRRGADRFLADLADVEAVDLDRQRLGLQPVAVAGDARRRRHVLLDLLAHAGALGLLVAALEVADHALERLRRLVGAEAIVIDEL